MKTINSNSIPKGSMHSSQKKTPASVKKNEKEQTSGKKLVQARLPFKILPGTETSSAPEKSVSASKLELLPKKRKLSYTEESENPKKIGKSDSKENLTRDKIETAASEVVIVLEDDDSDNATQPLSPKTPVSTFKSKKLNKSSSRSAGSTTTPKVQIKLPLSGKKKRKLKRASEVANCEESDVSDVELVCVNPQNSVKKAKLAENARFDVSIEDETPSKGDTNINEEKTRNTQKTVQPSPEKEKSPEGKTALKKSHLNPPSVDSEEPKSPSNVENPTPKTRKQSEDNVTPSQKQRTSDVFNIQSDQKRKEGKELVPDGKHFTDVAETKVNERKSSRRSTRQSEKAQKEEDQHQSSEEKSLSETEPPASEKTSTGETSFNNGLRKKLLTPKQLKLMEQRKILREEKERKLQQLKEEKDRKLQEQREERERKLQEEKIQKQKEREERDLQRKKEREEKDEQKRREKEEKEEQRRKEKEDKERKRLAEMEAKNEEKRKKDEAKEEERRKKEEERRRKELEKEEEENKKKKAAQAFTKFFVPKAPKPSVDEDPESRDDAENVDSLAFRPFQVKGDMKLAPLVRRVFDENSRGKLDSFLKSSKTSKTDLYIDQLKFGKHIPLRGLKTVLKDSDDDIIIIENELETAAQAIDEARPKPIQKFKAKFYFFRENRRPPFYGTWRKKSTIITPRRPFGIDKKFFDYEVDSDDEWEEEEPGESLNGSEDEKDESEDEDYEVDNEWFVPHGHLSDEELQNEDELGPDTSREAQKAKLKALQQEFANEMKRKTEKIKPRLIGAIWEDENGNRPNLCPSIIWDSLCARAMMICEQPLIEEPEVAEPEPITPPPEKLKRLEINDELMSDLVRLVHGNRHSKAFLIKEYIEHVSKKCDTIKSGECLAPTKSLIQKKIDEISEWSVVNESNSKKKNKKKLCWVVSADVLDKYLLAKLELRNEWTYTLQPKYNNDQGTQNKIKETKIDSLTGGALETSESVKKKPRPAGITKFAKILTKEEKQNQLSASSPTPSDSPNTKEKNFPKTLKANTSLKDSQKPGTSNSKKRTPPPTSSNKTPSVKKRVALLMSVPPGQDFSPQSKSALISNFLQKNKAKATSSNSVIQTNMDADVIKID